MKKIAFIYLVALALLSCNASKNGIAKADKNNVQNDTITIANDALEYEIIIIDSGFNPWLNSKAKPRGFYSELYLENKNQLFTNSWNSRVNQPMNYNPNLYETRIEYNPNLHYGYEVNYLLYNYFIYFQETYQQRL